jgi:hypothetical protein
VDVRQINRFAYFISFRRILNYMRLLEKGKFNSTLEFPEVLGMSTSRYSNSRLLSIGHPTHNIQFAIGFVARNSSEFDAKRFCFNSLTFARDCDLCICIYSKPEKVYIFLSCGIDNHLECTSGLVKFCPKIHSICIFFYFASSNSQP